MATITQMDVNSKLPSNGYMDFKSPVSSITEILSPALISTETQNAEPRTVLPVIEATGKPLEPSLEPTNEDGVEIDQVKADGGESLEPPKAAPATSTKTPATLTETSAASDESSSTCSEAAASSTETSASSNETPATSAEEVSTPPPPKSAAEKSNMILDILERYRMSNAKGVCKEWSGRKKVFDQVLQHIVSQSTIRMILPAFPFKSPNKAGKVLGDLPDTAEEVALKHLHGLCTMIGEIHGPGAQLFIVSDGLMYNDLLGVSDLEVWRYGQALRQLAIDLECQNVKFVRLADLLGREYSEPLTEESYLREAGSFRNELHNDNLPKDFDVNAFITGDPDATLTYRGYIKFLEKDLEHNAAAKTSTSKKRYHEDIAKAMMNRGKAFAAAIAKRFPAFIRLSIHASSSDASKLSVSLVPQQGTCTMTPWHSTLVRAVDGSITMSHAIRVPALTHDLIYEGDRPKYFREKSPLFSWPGMDLQFDYLYPTGLMIKPKDPTARYSLHNVHMQKVRGLAEKCSPVILRGFTDTTDERTFIAKAYDAGEVLPWTFGVMQKVKDARREDRLANNVVSSEAMPMHYDGMFKFMNKKDPQTGIESSVSCPPRFQYFTAKTPSPPGSGYTLFASSRLFFQHLPAKYSEEKLRKITWDCKNSGFWDNHMKNLPLIVSHPTTGEPCVRWHEPWPMWKTKFAHCVINIENGPQQYKQLVDQMLYDRRVCLYWTWEQGDVLVSDNFNMLHTRTAFEGDSDRELWRIHFD